MRSLRLNVRALGSVSIAGTLVLVGAVRAVSYQRGGLGLGVRASFLGFLAYQPDSVISVRYFKILATLSVASLVYFTFRWMNRGHRQVFPAGYSSRHQDLDFRSPWLRLAIVSVISVAWTVQELYKFSTHSYPYSPLESWSSNAVVLALSGALTFFGMKHLSFGPIVENHP